MSEGRAVSVGGRRASRLGQGHVRGAGTRSVGLHDGGGVCAPGARSGPLDGVVAGDAPAPTTATRTRAARVRPWVLWPLERPGRGPRRAVLPQSATSPPRPAPTPPPTMIVPEGLAPPPRLHRAAGAVRVRACSVTFHDCPWGVCRAFVSWLSRAHHGLA